MKLRESNSVGIVELLRSKHVETLIEFFVLVIFLKDKNTRALILG